MTYFIIVVSIAFFCLALKNLRWAVFVIAAILPAYLIRFSIGPLPGTLLEIFLLITFAVWIVKIKEVDFKGLRVRIKSWRWPVLLFLIAGVISIFVAPDKIAALGLFRAYLVEPILFFIVALSILKKEDVRQVIMALGISALAISIYAIFQRFTGYGIPAPWDKELRITSFYPFPNAVGLFLGPLIPIFFAQATSNIISFKDRLQKFAYAKICNQLFWWIVSILSILAIIFSQSEGAWVGVLVGLAVFGFLYKKTRLATVVGIAVALVVIFSVPIIREPVIQKLTLQDWSGKVRITQWKESTAMLRDNIFLGTGLAGYPTAFAPYHRATYIEIFQYPHNIILNFLTELGLLGVVAFAWLIINFFKSTIKLPPPLMGGGKGEGDHILTLSLIASMTALLIHGLVDVPYFKNDLAVEFWILITLAILTSASVQENKKMIN